MAAIAAARYSVGTDMKEVFRLPSNEIDGDPPEYPSAKCESMSLEMPNAFGPENFVLGYSGGSSIYTMLLMRKLASGEPFTVVDPKASIISVSRARAKKRLKAAGLRPAEANAIVRECAGRVGRSHVLRAAMRQKKRHASAWFPWDILIR